MPTPEEPLEPGQETGSEETAPSETVRSAVPEEKRPTTVPSEDEALPWGYGVDRVGAMAVDPERLFVYWEVTDESIERAREQAGPDAADAPVVLRVYDTTGRIFDGTNALDHFDHEIDRADRRWFFDIDKPGSSVIVELGLPAGDDGFVKIARSGRVEFPRAEPQTPTPPRWLTVRVRESEPSPSSGPLRPVPSARHEWPEPPRGVEIRPGHPGEPELSARHEWPEPHQEVEIRPGHPGEPEPSAAGMLEEPRSFEPQPAAAPAAAPAWKDPRPLLAERPELVTRQTEERRVFRREEPATWNRWETGAHTTELDAPAPWTESYSGETRYYHDGPQTRVVTGPWEVVIRGLGAFHRREVLAHWEIHRSWVTEEGREVVQGPAGNGRQRPGSSEQLPLGASERRWLAGSELRLSGSSERLFRGASERRLGGSSERAFRGASERRLGGASEKLRRGASERRLGGASETLRPGASERRLGGASETLRRWASERLYRRASERRLGGASERARRKPAAARVYPTFEDRSDDD